VQATRPPDIALTGVTIVRRGPREMVDPFKVIGGTGGDGGGGRAADRALLIRFLQPHPPPRRHQSVRSHSWRLPLNAAARPTVP